MRQKLFAAAVFSIISTVLYSQEEAVKPPGFFSKYTFSLSASTGLWYGHTEELVYQNGESSDYISELIWELKPVLNLGVEFELALRRPMEQQGFFLNLRGKFGLPNESGLMLDSDWTDSSNMKLRTHYSEQENHTHTAILLGGSTGWNFPVMARAAIKLYVNLAYRYFAFSAQNGYLDYPSGIKNIYGEVITFKQIFSSFTSGLSCYIKLANMFALEVFGDAGFVFYYDDEDFHQARAGGQDFGLQYHDYSNNGIEYNVGAKFHVLFNSNLALIAGFRYSGITNVRGYSEVRYMTIGTEKPDWSKPSYTAGAALSLFDIDCTFKITY
ncbi:MAG: omptin family outer membrane protease [Spirochaetaceae bacterium]|jgi:outer membrane protease|nr:omptin family outer membrane protease [Spirochaetaceae bacterium]